MRWAACRGWQAFPRASDACDRDGSLLLLKLIVHPKGTRQVESVSADGVGRYAPPQRPAAQCGLRISAPSHGRPVKPHPIQLCSSCFSRPAPLVLRLFSVAPKGPRLPAPTPGRLPPRREESWCAGERQKARHIRAFHGKKGIGGPLTDKNLEGAGSDGDLRLRVIIWESENPKRIGTRDSLLDNVKGNATLLGLQAVFAATPSPLGTASQPGLPHRTRLRPRSSSTVSRHTPRAQVWRRPLSYVRAPARGSTPPLPMQRSTAAPSPTRKRSTPSPACGRFTPSPICGAALRRRRSVYGYLVRHPHAKADGRRFGAARPLDDFADVDFRLGQLRTVGARLAVAPQTRGRFERHLSVEQLKKVISHLFARPFE